MLRRSSSALFCLFAALIAAGPAAATTYTFTNATNTATWNNPGNWSPNGVPNAGDDAVCTLPGDEFSAIQVTTYAECRSIHSSWTIAITTGSLTTIQGGSINGLKMQAVSFPYPLLINAGQLEITSDAELSSANIRQTAGAQVFFRSNCAVRVFGDQVFFEGGGFTVEGYLALHPFGTAGAALNLGGYDQTDPLTVLTNAPGALIDLNGGWVHDRTFLAGPVTHEGGAVTIFNQGTVRNIVGNSPTEYSLIESGIEFWNYDTGLVEAQASRIIILSPVNLDTNGRLSGARYMVHQGGSLSFARPITAVAGGTAITIADPGSNVDQLGYLRTIDGSVYIQNGANASFGAGSPSGLTNNGWLDIGAGSYVGVNGNYFQTPVATLSRGIADASASATPALYALGSISLNGTARADFASQALITPGARYPIATSACCAAGAFTSLITNALAAAPLMQYTVNSADLRVPPICPGDINNDGVINTSDLTLLLANFGGFSVPYINGDMNGDGYVNTTDLVQFLARFGSVCN